MEGIHATRKSLCEVFGYPVKSQGAEGRFPEVGQVILSCWTLFPRNFGPVGQNFLEKYVPWIHFSTDIFFYDTGTNF